MLTPSFCHEWVINSNDKESLVAFVIEGTNILIYPGTCEAEHAGEKAPGTPIKIVFPEAVSSARLMSLPGEPSKTGVAGTLSPMET